MEVINRDTQIAQIRNLDSFLRKNRLKGKRRSLYIFLYKKAICKRAYAFDLALCITANTLGFSRDQVISLLDDLDKLLLFNSLAITGDKMSINLKKFECYARA